MATNNWQRNIKLIIDEIEYPLELNSLKMYTDLKLIDSLKGSLYLYFNIGELSLSASREQIYLDLQTQQKIKNKLTKIVNDIKQKVDDKINSFENLWLANIYYNHDLFQSFGSLKFLGNIFWNGILLHNDAYLYIDNCSIFMFNKGKISNKSFNDPNKITKYLARSLTFKDKSMLFINDLPLKEITSKHVKKIFEDNPTISSVQIICPNSNTTLKSLDEKFQINKMMPLMLSSYVKSSNKGRAPEMQEQISRPLFQTRIRLKPNRSYTFNQSNTRR